MGINWADADCHFGDHFYQKPNGVRCTNCGFINYPYLSYLGWRARAAKKAGITVEEWETRQEALAVAEMDRLEKEEFSDGR